MRLFKIFHELFCGRAQGELFAVHDHKLAGRKLFCQHNLKQVRRSPRQTVIRHKSDSETDGGQIQQEIVAAQLDFRHQIQLMLLKKIVQVLAGGTLAGQHENGIVQKLPEGKPLVFQIKIMAVGDKDILETADFFQVPGISQPGIGVIRSTWPFSSRSTQPMEV